MATAFQVLYTAEEFARRPDPGYPEELVRGRIVAMPVPQARHGLVCNKSGRILSGNDELTSPELLGDFRVPVSRFFE
jgi:hypothetical protein